MSHTLHHGNCLDVLPTLPDCSIDSIVTDPPYELGFMGKKWDASGIAYNITLWQECLRVLKPGGHLLAFGGTRTYHRMACAIEDAGFEIRDSIHWLYGSGFPKSLDVSKAIDKQRDDRKDIEKVVRWLEEQRIKSGVTRKQVENFFGTVNIGQSLFTITPGSSPRVATWDQWLKLKELLRFGDEMDAEVWRLNGRKSQPGEAWAEREVIGTRKQNMTEDSVWATQCQTGRFQVGEKEWDITIPATDEAKRWAGWGTALKPAHEPVVVARKPLEGTVAGNVLRWGTGAINIDATRIAGDMSGGVWGSSNKTVNMDRKFNSSPEMAEYRSEQHAAGRWPANVILSHAEDCQQVGIRDDVFGGGAKATSGFVNGYEHDGFVGQSVSVPVWECVAGCPVAELDQQSGTSKSGKPREDRGTGGIWAEGNGVPCGPQHGDVGGASRFFYCAKPSRRERNTGLDALKDKEVHRYGAGIGEGKNPDAPAIDKNHHPTVKPLALMRYLVRLVTPPDGTVLDPFAGSGTTLMAAILENFTPIGIEMTDEYLPIIQGRIAWAINETQQPQQPELQP